MHAWRWLSSERARDLARHEPFAYTWRLLVVRLHDLGEHYLELHGDEVTNFIDAAIQDFRSTSTPPTTEPPALQRRNLRGCSGVHALGKRSSGRRVRALEYALRSRPVMSGDEVALLLEES